MKWLADCSPATLAEAPRAVAPELSGYSIVIPGLVGEDDPLWWSSSAVAGGQFVAKFAWSLPAALRVAHETGVLAARAREPGVPFLPEVVASGADPPLLVTRLVPGATLFEVVDSTGRDRAGRRSAWFLAALRQPATRTRVEAAVGGLPAARHVRNTRPRRGSCAIGRGGGCGRISAEP